MKKIAFWIGAVLILVAPAVAYNETEETAVATLALIATLSFTIITRLDDLAELSFGPLKAKMRETLAEATATVRQLRDLGSALARTSLTDLMSGEFFGGMPLKRRMRLHELTIKNLRALGLTEDQIAYAEVEWNLGIRLIYARAIRKALQRDEALNNSERGELAEGFQKLVRWDEWKAPAPSEVRSYFADRSYKPSAEVAALLADYEHFSEHGDLRSRDKFETL